MLAQQPQRRLGRCVNTTQYGRRCERVRHGVEPRHGNAILCKAVVGREADEHAARRGGLDGRRRRAAELSLESARRGRAVVHLHKVTTFFGFE